MLLNYFIIAIEYNVELHTSMTSYNDGLEDLQVEIFSSNYQTGRRTLHPCSMHSSLKTDVRNKIGIVI